MKILSKQLLRPLNMVGVSMAIGLMAVPVLDAGFETGLFRDSSALAQREEPRPPPEARSAGTLSRQISARVLEVIEFTDMEDFVGALEVMQEIRDQYDRDRLNDLETFTMWQFYANIAQLQEQYDQALEYYQNMLVVPNIPLDRALPAYRAVAILHQVQEDYRSALEAFEEYMSLVEMPEADIYLRVATIHYQLEEYAEAVPYLRQNMDMLRAAGTEIPQNTYALLRSLYFSLEDLENFRQVNREMIVLYNNPDDWGYLASANSQLDRFADQGYVLYVAQQGGYLDTENQLMQLAFARSNNDDPYGAASVIQDGMDMGIIDDNDADNLSYLSQFYQLAREDERAIPPIAKAAELEDDPNLYVRLGRLHMNLYQFEEAIEAFNRAFQMGEVDRPDQTLLSLARAYVELDMYDDAIEAAQEASTDERSRDTARTFVTSLQNAKRQYDAIELQKEQRRDFFLPGQLERMNSN